MNAHTAWGKIEIIRELSTESCQPGQLEHNLAITSRKHKRNHSLSQKEKRKREEPPRKACFEPTKWPIQDGRPCWNKMQRIEKQNNLAKLNSGETRNLSVDHSKDSCNWKENLSRKSRVEVTIHSPRLLDNDWAWARKGVEKERRTQKSRWRQNGEKGKMAGWGLNKENQENYCEKHKRAPMWNSTNAIWALNDVMTQKGTNFSTRSIASLGIRVEQIRKTTTKYRRKSDVRHSITLLTPLLRIPYPK